MARIEFVGIDQVTPVEAVGNVEIDTPTTQGAAERHANICHSLQTSFDVVVVVVVVVVRSRVYIVNHVSANKILQSIPIILQCHQKIIII